MNTQLDFLIDKEILKAVQTNTKVSFSQIIEKVKKENNSELPSMLVGCYVLNYLVSYIETEGLNNFLVDDVNVQGKPFDYSNPLYDFSWGNQNLSIHPKRYLSTFLTEPVSLWDKMFLFHIIKNNKCKEFGFKPSFKLLKKYWLHKIKVMFYSKETWAHLEEILKTNSLARITLVQWGFSPLKNKDVKNFFKLKKNEKN